MAAPAYATDLTTFWLEGATTVTAIGTGGAALGNPETDFFIQGTDCISKGAWTNATKGFIIDGLATTFTVPTDGAVVAFAKYDAQGSLDTKANGGLQMLIGSGAGNYNRYYIGGKDTLQFDSWVPYVVDPNTATGDGTAAGTPDGTERWVGLVGNLPTTSGPTKGNPIAMDAIRYGRCRIDYTLGDGTTPATFDGAELAGNVNSSRWGLLEKQKGAFQTQGFHSIGTAGTACDFRDANKVLFWRPASASNETNDGVSTAFNRVEIINAGTNCDWTNIIWQSLDTNARGVFVHTAGTFDAVLCQFIDWDTFTFIAASVATDTTFRRCNAITAPGCTLNGSSVLESTVAANTSALVWDANVNPSSKMDGMSFSKDATVLHHAIEFGTTSPLTLDLVDVVFTDFNGTPGSGDNQNDSTFHVKRTTGTVNINISGSVATPASSLTYRSDGATVNINQNVTVTLTGLVNNSEVSVYDTGTGAEIAHVENVTGNQFAFSDAAANDVYIYIHHIAYYRADLIGFIIPGSAASIPIQQVADPNYVNN